MSDDECGHPTENGDGPPCQNPAGDDGTCWIPTHGDPDATNPHGRDYSITEADHDDILEAARMGMSKAGCARAAGVSDTELARYVDAHADFRGAFMRARHQGEKRLVMEALYTEEDAPREMDGQHARFLLSTSFDYVKTERKELTGEDGGAIEVDSDVVTVTEASDDG